MSRVAGPFRCEDSASVQRPAVMPDDPAVVAGVRWEANFVLVKREAGVSWQNIAQMLGRNAAEVQAAYRGIVA